VFSSPQTAVLKLPGEGAVALKRFEF
jgi:hypothetical protein